MLTACQSMPTQTTVTTDRVACQAFKLISYSAKNDTPETIQEVREHNAAYTAICGDK